MIKIKFPSPNELSAKDWLEQMELTLYHIKKAYDKFSIAIPEEKKEDISLRFSYPEMERNDEFQNLTMNEDVSFEDTQEIELVIDY